MPKAVSGSVTSLEFAVTVASRLYAALHSAAESAGSEFATSKRFASELRGLGFRVDVAQGGTGFVATLENGVGAHVLVRAELDGLVIAPSVIDYQNDPGRGMQTLHACGHDVHMAAAAGAAAYLAHNRHLWAGRLSIVGQPAEENLTGARAIIHEFDALRRADFALTQHVVPLPVGVIALSQGRATAWGKRLTFQLSGGSGHAAYDGESPSTAEVVGSFVSGVERLVQSRKLAEATSTVTSIAMGFADHSRPRSADVSVFIRADSTLALTAAEASIIDLLGRSGAEYRLVAEQTTPPVINDSHMVNLILKGLRSVMDEERVVPHYPGKVVDDFSLYQSLAGVPSAMIMTGSVATSTWNQLQGSDVLTKLRYATRNHDPAFLPDTPSTLRMGITALVASVNALTTNKER